MRQSDTKEPDRQNAQLILLSGFMIMLGTLTFLVLLNNLILTANLPTSGLDLSKQDVKEFRTLAISEIEYAAQITLEYNISNPSANETQLREYFFNYTDVMGENLSRVFAARGTSVEVKVNNVSFTSTLTNDERTITVQKFITQGHFFPNESLIIPMDGYQNNTLQAYRFVWNIVNNTSVPVYSVLQDPVNSSNINFYLNVTSDDIAVPSMGPGNIQLRSYSGGPFMIDATNLDNSTLQWIYNESLNFTSNITIHGLSMEGGINLDYTVAINEVPSVAVYQYIENTIDKYYSDMMIPYTNLSDNDIKAGDLTIDNYSVLLTHENMSTVDDDVVLAIVNWTADGGVLYAEYLGSATMDIAVEAVDNNTAHPWFGFIGINESNASHIPSGPYIKLVNSSYVLNLNPPMPISGLVNDGAPFNQISQTNNISGMYGPVENHSSGRGLAFTLNNTTNAVNNGTNIIGYLAYSNGSQITYDNNGELEYHLAYVEAPFENGRVIYMAGHNISERGIQAERIAGEIFYASVFRDQVIIDTHNINVTLTYNDGMATFEDTVLLEI